MNKFDRRPTLDDVAAAAGVSKSTVSYVLSGKKSISRDVSDRVFRTIDELGYLPRVSTPNLARQLQVLAFCMPIQTQGDFSEDSYYLPLIEGAHAAASEAGFDLAFHPLAPDSPAMELFFKNLPLYQGVVLGNLWVDHRFRNAVKGAGVPYLYYGTPEPEEQTTSFYLDVDVVGAGYQAAEHLISQGHRDIFFVEMSDEMIQTRKHIEGYKQAFQENSIPWTDDNVIFARVNMDECQALVREILSRRDDITAFVAVNDVMARGILMALTEAGIPVPQKTAVLSMGGTLTARDSIPKLTSVDYHPYENGRMAITMLIDIIQKRRMDPCNTLIPSTLIQRDTT